MTTTRDRILTEAAHQLAAGGYAAFTITGVRESLGLSSGSMFHAFPSKPALAASVYVHGMADYHRVATAAVTSTRDPERALRAWIGGHLAWIEDHRDLARHLFSTQPDEVMALAAQPLAAHNDAFSSAVDTFLERATTAGLMGHVPRAVAHALCIGPAHEYGYQWTRGTVAISPRRIARTLQRAAVAALAATLPSPRRRNPPRSGGLLPQVEIP